MKWINGMRFAVLIVIVLLLAFLQGNQQEAASPLAEAIEAFKEQINKAVWLYGEFHDYMPYCPFIGKTIDVSIYKQRESFVFFIADEEQDIFCKIPIEKYNSNGYTAGGGSVSPYKHKLKDLSDVYEYIQEIRIKISELYKPEIVMDDRMMKDLSDIKELAMESEDIDAPPGEYTMGLMWYDDRGSSNENDRSYGFYLDGDLLGLYAFYAHVYYDTPTETRIEVRPFAVDHYKFVAIQKVKHNPYYEDTITISKPDDTGDVVDAS